MRVFDNPDLYPTPYDVIERMCIGIDLKGKTVLEPSAGMGDIVDFCAGSGATVLACEIVPDLQDILNGKNCKLIAEDFANVKPEQISHVDYIIMNPPFSKDEHHIVHAWEIAPAGCKILALCNAATVENPRGGRARILKQLITDYGFYENWGNCFSDAERQTDVMIGFIKLLKPKGKTDDEFEGFFMEEEEEAQEIGLQQYNFVRDVVNRYVAAIKVFDMQLALAGEMNDLVGSFSKTKIALQMVEDDKVKTREEYKKELQKDAWNWVIGKFNLNKYSTTGLREDINKFVEQQTAIPFTMKNIYQMINIIIGTSGNRMDKALEEVFDAFTQHYHQNRYGSEGWKTNSHYLINEKFIVPYIAPQSKYSYGPDISHTRADKLDDFTKALCYITGQNYDNFPRFYLAAGRRNGVDAFEWGEWFDWGFFQVKLYKKGTGHFKFKDRDVWALFNQHVARIKGFPLPEAIKKKTA